MNKKEIRVRKEVVRCDVCKKGKEFLYLSDFAYGQRLIYFDNMVNIAFIDLLEDNVFLEYVDMVKKLIEEHGISCSPEQIKTFIDKSFGITCDTIYGANVDLSIGQKKCLHCGSTKFERNMIEPESIEIYVLPVVSHDNWELLSNNEKKSIIIDELKKEGFFN